MAAGAANNSISDKRYAVVTGANKGIGFEICRQLASHGITVVLTARDEKRGVDALQKLEESGFSDRMLFHQLDVANSSSIASFAEFVKTQFGRLDILVNNAGILGTNVDPDGMRAAAAGGQFNWKDIASQNYDLAVECLQINYYGAKRMTEAFVPLLQLSQSPRIVNVSSSIGKLKKIPGERIRGIFNDENNLTEGRLNELLNEFLKDFKEGSLEVNGWPPACSAYIVSKAAMNAYTRILAKKYPNMKVNCVCPGYVKTDINFNTGMLSLEEGAASPVRYAVVTGSNKGIGFEICRQLASRNITVVLTARNEKKGLEALERLQSSGLSHNLVFHQLDVTDPISIASLAEFVKTQFGRLDILVNNAGIIGVNVDADALKASGYGADGPEGAHINWDGILVETYELAVECLQTNYYGTKRMVETFVPLLHLSDTPRIVNVSSAMGKLKAKAVLSDPESLTEEKMDEVLNEFLKDFKEGSLQARGWPAYVSAYAVSKAAMNAYTRILARKYRTFRANCVCPGFVKTDINFNTGKLTSEEGAESPVRLALLPGDGPSGFFFVRNEVSSFE